MDWKYRDRKDRLTCNAYDVMEGTGELIILYLCFST